MTDREPGSLEHNVEKSKEAVWLVGSAILVIQAHQLLAADEALLGVIAFLIASLCFIAAIHSALQTNRHLLPVARALGSPEANFYYESPEEVLDP